MVVLLLGFLVATLGQSGDRYFKKDAYTGAEYLRFAADGRYERILREHMGVWVADRGQWRKEGDNLIVLESDRLVREVAGAVGRIPVSERSRALLPALRGKLQALLEAYPVAEPVPVPELRSLSVESDPGRLWVELEPAIETKSLVSRGEIQSLLNAMDEYLLSQLRHSSRNRIEIYRGITFLVSMGEGVHAPILDAEETRSRIDALDGGIPAYVLAEVSRHVYECEIRTTSPFRFVQMSCPDSRHDSK